MQLLRPRKGGPVRCGPPPGRSIPLEPYGTSPATLSSPVGKYPWAETERAFAAIADHATGSEVDGISLEYTNPWTGGPVLPTTSCRVQRLVPGFRGAARRHTAATILHVVRGEGRTVINGEELRRGAVRLLQRTCGQGTRPVPRGTPLTGPGGRRVILPRPRRPPTDAPSPSSRGRSPSSSASTAETA